MEPLTEGSLPGFSLKSEAGLQMGHMKHGQLSDKHMEKMLG